MPRHVEMIGQRFGRLVVKLFARRTRWPSGMTCLWWRCRCDCGKTKIARTADLRGGDTQNSRKIATRHGMSDAPEYYVWSSMIQRCHTRSDRAYKWYGARGIRVCRRWRNGFENFFADMGRRPSPKHQLERKRNDRGYSPPKNCVWAAKQQQMNNMRSNVRLRAFGKTMTIAQWTRRLGFPRTRIYLRLARGWSIKKALDPRLYSPGGQPL